MGSAQDFREVEAPAPTVPAYSSASDTDGEIVHGASAEAVRAGVQRAAEIHGMPLEGDARLGQLASWVAERLGPEGEPPPNEVVEFFARNLGLVEPVPHIMVLGQPADTLEDGVADSIGQFMQRQVYNRYGGAVVPRAGLAVAVVLLSWRWVELEPVPRRVEQGDALTLRGRLLGDHRNPTVVVAPPDGQVRRLPAGGGPDFDVRVPTTAAGVYQVELVGRGEHGDTGHRELPGLRRPADPGPSPPRWGAPGRSAGRRERAAGALRRAQRDPPRRGPAAAPRARGAARGRARAQPRHGRARLHRAHLASAPASPSDRVRAAGLTSGLVLENIGRGYSAQEIHRGLMESPGHRANLVNPDVTHVGIGVVAQTEGARSAFLVTEVFVRMSERVDLSGAPERLVSSLNRARSARGAPPLSLEEHLSEAAQHAADEFFADPSLTQQDAIDDASGSLRRFAIAYRRIGGVMAVVANVDEAGALEPALDPDVRR